MRVVNSAQRIFATVAQGSWAAHVSPPQWSATPDDMRSATGTQTASSRRHTRTHTGRDEMCETD